MASKCLEKCPKICNNIINIYIILTFLTWRVETCIAEMMFDGTMDEQTRKAYEKKLSQKTVDLGLHR